MKIRRMLVTGASGMVGSYVPEIFSDVDLIPTDLHGENGFYPLDIRDRAAVERFFKMEKPDAVLHLAAATDVDRCEQDPQWAHSSNVLGTEHVASVCRASGAKLVYASTGAVFWGDKRQAYAESDEPRPLNIYGQSKRAGEKAVAEQAERFLIVRAGWMFGGGEKDKKFVRKIVRMMLEGVPAISAVNDKWGTPTYAKDFLKGTRMLLERGCTGLYHLGNEGSCTRYEIALALREILKQPQVVVQPVSSECFPLPAPRGRQEGIANVRLKEEQLPAMRPWRQALEEYVLTELVLAAR